MAVTASDILHDADAYRRAYPGYGRQVPAITAESPPTLDEEAEQIATEERWA